jgi:hypothetical protein
VSSTSAAARSARGILLLVSAVALLGCQSRPGRERSPLPGGWTAVDAGARDVPLPRDATPRDLAPSRDVAPRDMAPRDAAPRDAAPRDAAPRDAAHADRKGDAAIDARGTRSDGAGRDLGAHDTGARDAGQNLGGRDGSAADSESALCGSLHFSCAPYACDVDAGQCKNFCTSADDCAPGRLCLNGFCGPNDNEYCLVDDECLSGHCAVVCCATACADLCHSCVLPGTIGVCAPVPAGMPDPERRCPAGMVCGADAGCVPGPDAG